MVTRSSACARLLLASLVAACGGNTSEPADAAAPKDTGHTTTHPDAGKDATADAKKPTADAGVDATSDATSAAEAGDASDGGFGDVGAADAPFDATGFVAIDGGSSIITQTTPETWSWIPFPDSRCRDGSTTGLGVNFNPSSPNLLIYLEAGGACFNSLTCSGNPSSFGASDLPQRFPSAADGGVMAGNGILDRTNAANPVADWNFVYVPYCTGDVHAGNNPNGSVDGVTGTQQFVGYQNMNLFLERVVPTFPTATQVVLSGLSGGGFGAAANYAHVQRAFGSVPVNLLDDSGPFFEAPYLAACLQDQFRSLWGLDSTVGADCAGHCNNPATYFFDLAHLIVDQNPTRQFGLIEATADGTIRDFFGFGDEECQSFAAEDPTMFAAGLDDIRTKFAANPGLGTFYFTGTDHTSIGDDSFYTRETPAADGGTVVLSDWVGTLVAGHPYNAGP